MLQNILKTHKNSENNIVSDRCIKPTKIMQKQLVYPLTLKSNIVLNVSNINSHKNKQTNKQTKHNKHGRIETTKRRV